MTYFGASYFGPSSGTTTTESSVVVGSKTIIRLTRNDSYDGTANDVKTFTVTRDYSSGWTGIFTVRHRVTNVVLLTKTVSVASTITLELSLTSTDTAFALLTTDEDFGPHPFDIEMVSGSSKQSAVKGIAIITKDQTTA